MGVTPAVGTLTSIRNLLALQTELRPGKGAEPLGPDLLFAVRADAVFAFVQPAQGFFNLAQAAHRTVKASNGEVPCLGSLHLVHFVRRLLNARFIS
jgi:hypothetical protein